MNENTRKRLYVLADLGWRGVVGLGKAAFCLGLISLIPSLALDWDDSRKRRARMKNNNKNH